MHSLLCPVTPALRPEADTAKMTVQSPGFHGPFQEIERVLRPGLLAGILKAPPSATGAIPVNLSSHWGTGMIHPDMDLSSTSGQEWGVHR